MNKILKRLIIGGILFLGASLPGSDEFKLPSPRTMPERQITFGKRDPFVPPKGIAYLISQDEKVIKSLDELTRRLEKDGFDKSKVQAAYADERFTVHQEIIKLFTRSPEAQGARGAITYDIYRKNLGLDDKLARAPDFLNKYKDELALAEKKFGVDKRYVVAILGVESDFGNNPGHYYAFNALVSLYTTQSMKEFAYNELKEYFLICNKKDKGVYNYKASYAGALTPAQFIPSSYNKLFISKDEGQTGDPNSIEDCIHSICNYLQKSGWNSKDNEQAPVEGSANWKAIFSYNHSSFYVKSITELATKAKWSPEDLKVVASDNDF